MDLGGRTKTVAELRSDNRRLVLVILGLSAALVLISAKHFVQTEIVIQQTPGMPNNSVIEKTAMDKGAQRATLIALTSALAQVNPANAAYQKAFVQAYLAPAAYTRVSKEIDAQVARLVSQRELGSYYFIFRAHEYDPTLDKHFVMGEVHTVNAAKDTFENYVFEYSMHIENYRPVVDEITTYIGVQPHNSEWKKANKK